MPGTVSRYKKRISGPINDRIDLNLHVPAVASEKLTLTNGKNAESSKNIRERVQKARNIQLRRFEALDITSNAEMSTKMVKEFCPLLPEVSVFMRQAVTRISLSARGFYRVIKVARTIADLSGEKTIALLHVAEALQYRPQE